MLMRVAVYHYLLTAVLQSETMSERSARYLAKRKREELPELVSMSEWLLTQPSPK